MNKTVALRRALWMVAAIGIVSISAIPRANANVIAGSTFSISVVGYNSSGASYLTAPVDPVFGTTQTFTGDALGGQNLTVSSSETIGAITTTDIITISVPTNFDPSGTTVGSPPSAVLDMETDLGGYNAGADPLDFSSPLVNLSVIGFMTYSGGTFPLNPGVNDILSNGNESLATAETVGALGQPLSGAAISSFTFEISYDNPVSTTPEPGTLSLVGTAAAGFLTLRRRLLKTA